MSFGIRLVGDVINSTTEEQGTGHRAPGSGQGWQCSVTVNSDRGSVQRTAFRKNTGLAGGGGELRRTADSVQRTAFRKSAMPGAGIGAGLVGCGGEFGEF
jgi:hypothetical protein